MQLRQQCIEAIKNQEFDLVVVGGGISGAGVAHDAASRGLSVLLMEKDDFASGTSSRTTKLIHGGLRYLEQLHVKLTRELLKERALLQKLAPHLVKEMTFVLPLFNSVPWLNLKASVGLVLYDLLSFPCNQYHQRLSSNQVLEAVPELAGSNFSGGLSFYDCVTDDARMVMEVIKTACRNGAIAINYLEATGFDIEEGKTRAVYAHDRNDGTKLVINCKTCVNATGVWSDEVCGLVDNHWRPQIISSKGTHIVVPQSSFHTNTGLFLPTPDQRYVFMLPWQQALLIGTTDQLFKGNLDRPVPAQEEIEYLLSVVNTYTQSQTLTAADVISSFSGLRPLIKFPGVSVVTSKISREHLVFEGPGGMIGLAGGKLTNFRVMAKEVVDRCFRNFPDSRFQPSTTSEIMLSGFVNYNHYLTLSTTLSVKARQAGIIPATLEHLLASYGTDAEHIVELVENDPSLNTRISPDFPFIMAEVPFCVQEEMVVSLEDLLLRRLRLGILHQRQCLEAAPTVARLVQELLGWDAKRVDLELSALQSACSSNTLKMEKAL